MFGHENKTVDHIQQTLQDKKSNSHSLFTGNLQTV